MTTARRQHGFSLVEIVIVVAVLLIVATIVMPRSSNARTEAEEVALQTTVASVRHKLMEHYAANASFPPAIDAGWFISGRVPSNPFAPDHENAILTDGGNDVAKSHPAGKLILPTGAFWYNPANGVFRARITDQGEAARNIALYNRVNGTRITTWDQTTD